MEDHRLSAGLWVQLQTLFSNHLVWVFSWFHQLYKACNYKSKQYPLSFQIYTVQYLAFSNRKRDMVANHP